MEHALKGKRIKIIGDVRSTVSLKQTNKERKKIIPAEVFNFSLNF